MAQQTPGSGFHVRRGSSADLDRVRTVYSAVAAEGLWIGGELPVSWTSERQEEWCRVADDDERGALFLAEGDVLAEDNLGELLGYLSVRRSGGEHADFGMAVTSAHRGRGIGGSLLDATVAWCRAASLSKVSCQVWPHNGAALGLYRSRGFVVEGRLRRHWRRRNGQLWDAVVMGLVLDEHSPGSGLADAQPFTRPV